MKQKAKNEFGQNKNLSYFLIFLRRETTSGLDILPASTGGKGAHQKFLDQKSVRFEGSRMLRHGVISNFNMRE